MFCKQCGEKLEPGQNCPKCGTADATDVSVHPRGGALSENTAGVLCYILGWITGIILFIVDKRPFVRFHAAQSIVTFGALSILTFVLSRIISIFPYAVWRLLSGINSMIGVASLILAVFLIIQAYKGKRYSLPVAGAFAEKLAEKNAG